MSKLDVNDGILLTVKRSTISNYLRGHSGTVSGELTLVVFLCVRVIL